MSLKSDSVAKGIQRAKTSLAALGARKQAIVSRVFYKGSGSDDASYDGTVFDMTAAGLWGMNQETRVVYAGASSNGCRQRIHNDDNQSRVNRNPRVASCQAQEFAPPS